VQKERDAPRADAGVRAALDARGVLLIEPRSALLDEGIPPALGTDGIGAVNNPSRARSRRASSPISRCSRKTSSTRRRLRSRDRVDDGQQETAWNSGAITTTP
jgi:hypothetical protein